jgi:MFS family permease
VEAAEQLAAGGRAGEAVGRRGAEHLGVVDGGEPELGVLLWLPYYMQWGALLSIVWPSQIGVIAGETKELWNGIIIALGAAVALVVTPVAGALSDASTHPRGRRRPYLVWGGALNVLTLLFLGTVGKGSRLGVLVLGILGVQFSGTWWGGPYAGMIPDVIPPTRRGLASGYMMVMMAVGWGAGTAAAGVLARPEGYGAIYAVLAGTLALGLAITLSTVREPPGAQLAHPRDWRRAVRDFLPPVRAHADFYWVLATRTVVGMGIWGVGTYIVYYLQEVAGIPRPEPLSAMLFLAGGAVGVPAGLYAGSLSDRIGRKGLVYASGALMAASSLIYGLGAAHPTLWLMWVSAILFGLGNNVYSAVDWAFALDALPAQRSAGKDMGIWHVSMVLPQVVAMPISAVLLTVLTPVSSPLAYAVLFIVSAFWFGIGTVLVRRVRGIR